MVYSRKYMLIAVTLIMIMSLTCISSAKVNQQSPQWTADAGDTRTYIVTKYYDVITNTDGDPTQETKSIVTGVTESGAKITANHILKVGTTMKVEVMQTASENITTGAYYVSVSVTYDNQVRAREHQDYGHFVAPTTDDRTYWENYASNYANTTLEEDYLIITTDITKSSGMTVHVTVRRNWRTGWLSSYLNEISNQTGTIYEYEFSEVTDTEVDTGTDSPGDLVAPGFELIPLLFTFLIVTVVISRKRRNQNKTSQ